MFKIFTRSLRDERDQARSLAETYQNAYLEQLRTNSRLHGRLFTREAALNAIVASVDSITTPNGTLRKVRRIASQAVA